MEYEYPAHNNDANVGTWLRYNIGGETLAVTNEHPRARDPWKTAADEQILGSRQQECPRFERRETWGSHFRNVSKSGPVPYKVWGH